MTITLEQQSAYTKIKADAIILPWVQSEKKSVIELPEDAKKLVTSLMETKEFTGRHLETTVVRVVRPRLITFIFVGLGKKNEGTAVERARAIGAGIMRAKRLRIESVAVVCPDDIDVRNCASAVREANYSFTKYKSKKQRDVQPVRRCVVLLSRVPTGEDRRSLRDALAFADSMDRAKDIGNADSQEITPATLAKTALELAKEFPSIQVRVLGMKELEKEQCGGIIAVGKGSQHEPKLIVLEYNNAPKGTRPTALVGKAITFDTGGISIKPWKQMDEMKYDMCGGAAVLGVMRTIAATKLPIHVVGLIAAAENMPSHTAFKPGDVVRMADGTTVEIISTDAEGRLVVADAMVYARRYKPAVMIDIATLTGAVIAALGDYATGLFTDNETLAEDLLRIGNETGDRVWRLPLVKEWKKLMKSTFADLKNASDGKIGGATMGGLFLQHFVEKKTVWAHLDIAGTAWNMAATPWMEAGATGAGIQLVFEYLRKFAQI